MFYVREQETKLPFGRSQKFIVDSIRKDYVFTILLEEIIFINYITVKIYRRCLLEVINFEFIEIILCSSPVT